MGVEAKAPSEHRSERTRRCVSEERRRQRTHRRPARRAGVAERAGFEPAVLSHTAFRERHHQPLGHLSAGEDTKATPGRPAGTRGQAVGDAGEQRLGFVAPDPAHDLDPSRQARVLRQLQDRPGRALARVGDREDERLDVAGEERPDAHRAWLVRREDRGVGEAAAAEAAGGFAQGDDHGMGGRVVRLLDPIMGAGDHRLVDDGDRGDRPLTALDGELGLRQRLAHEELVVHGPDASRRSSRAPFACTEPQPVAPESTR